MGNRTYCTFLLYASPHSQRDQVIDALRSLEVDLEYATDDLGDDDLGAAVIAAESGRRTRFVIEEGPLCFATDAADAFKGLDATWSATADPYAECDGEVVMFHPGFGQWGAGVDGSGNPHVDCAVLDQLLDHATREVWSLLTVCREVERVSGRPIRRRFAEMEAAQVELDTAEQVAARAALHDAGVS